jgi:hypothetical protein
MLPPNDIIRELGDLVRSWLELEESLKQPPSRWASDIIRQCRADLEKVIIRIVSA